MPNHSKELELSSKAPERDSSGRVPDDSSERVPDGSSEREEWGSSEELACSKSELGRNEILRSIQKYPLPRLFRRTKIVQRPLQQ